MRVGIAVCDPDWILASPVEVYVRRDTESDADYFRQLATIEKLTGLVVGLPVYCDGGESQSSSNARAYAKWLGSVTSLPVRLFDERFSTASANEKLSGAKLTRKKKKNPPWSPCASQMVSFEQKISWSETDPVSSRIPTTLKCS